MSKPTIFFSHSSRDKVIVKRIKDSLIRQTGGTIDIFMSSDGESIPLGKNWIHKIEEGLDQASIMLVFVTPNSVQSDWIYFEAGFAYSRNKEVVPIGLGIDIGAMKPPLSLLQGFNMSSSDSMNNLIAIINSKFDYSFSEDFTGEDFTLIDEQQSIETDKYLFSRVFSRLNYSVRRETNLGDDKWKNIDIEKMFGDIKSVLDREGISYSYEQTSQSERILVAGISISVKYKNLLKNRIENPEKIDSGDELELNISTYNIDRSIKILNVILSELTYLDSIFFWFYLNPDYAYIYNDEDLSSLLFEVDGFSPSEKRVGGYKYLNNQFSIFEDRFTKSGSNQMILSLYMPEKEVELNYFYNLMKKLVERGIIYSAQVSM